MVSNNQGLGPLMALKEPLDYKEHVERDNFVRPEIFKQPKLQ